MDKKHSSFKELLKIIGMALVVILPVIFLYLYIRLFPMNYGDDELAYYLWNKDVTKDSDSRYYSTLILGDSSANASYLPELLSEGTINLALGGTTPIENYYVLNNWLETHEAPKSVFISFIDYHLIYDNMFYERTVYSHLLTPAQEQQIVSDSFSIGEDYIAVDDAKLQLFEYDHYFPNKYMPSLLNAGFSSRLADNQANYASVSLHRGAYIGMTTDYYTATKPFVYESFMVNDIFDYYYRKLLELCETNDIRTYIISLPKPENAVLTESYLSKRDGYYRDLAETYEHVQYYASAEKLSGNYFHDWEHFNLYGARYWSEYVRSGFAHAFEQEPLSETSKQGILDYMNRCESPEGLIGFADGQTYAAVVITNETGSVAGNCDETGLFVKNRNVYIKKHSNITVTVQEAASADNGFCIWTEPDGSCAIVSHETVYGLDIDDSADLTVIIVDAQTHMPVIVRNYIRGNDGFIYFH